MMQINRLFEIVYLLLEKPMLTAGELAERFEVSTRTIYRDIVMEWKWYRLLRSENKCRSSGKKLLKYMIDIWHAHVIFKRVY